MKDFQVKTKPISVFNVTRIVTIHYFEFGQNFVFDGEKHNFWEMVYIDKGAVKVLRDKEELVFKQGDIVFHKPNEFHAIRAHESSPCFFVITFICNSPLMRFFEKYATYLNKSLRPFISSIIREAERAFVIPKNETKFFPLEKKDDSEIGAEQLIKTYLEQLFIMLLRNRTQKRETVVFPTKESLENHIVFEIKEYAEKHLTERIRVDDVCKSIGYGKSYLYKLFKNESEKSVIGYINERKIERAKTLIREGNMNFTEISDLLAFDNPQYFCRVFKRITGITPSEYRSSLHIR